MGNPRRSKSFQHLSEDQTRIHLARSFHHLGSQWAGPLAQPEAVAFLTGLHSLLGSKEILNLLDPIQAGTVSYLRHWLTRIPDLPENADVGLALGRVRQHEHLVAEDQLRLVLTPGGITLNRSIVKTLSDRETRSSEEAKSFVDISGQGAGLVLTGLSLFSLHRQGTWINCFAPEGINLDGLLDDLSSHLANTNAVETTVRGRVLRRLIDGYDDSVDDLLPVDLGPEADPWSDMAAFKLRSANQ